jgi:hypothetical protein
VNPLTGSLGFLFVLNPHISFLPFLSTSFLLTFFLATFLLLFAHHQHTFLLNLLPFTYLPCLVRYRQHAKMSAKEPEKDINCLDVVQTQEVESGVQTEFKEIPLNQAIAPSEDDEFVDPRLKNYPIPLVAKVVSLENDPK